jgi:hypothetical protein
MAARILRKIRFIEKTPKVLQVAMKVACHHDVNSIIKGHDTAATTSGGLECLNGLRQGI